MFSEGLENEWYPLLYEVSYLTTLPIAKIKLLRRQINDYAELAE